MWSSLFLALFLGASPVTAPLPELVEGLARPRLIGVDVSAELPGYSVGSLRLEEATEVFPVAVGSSRVGYFVVGGTFAVELADELGGPTFELNVKRASPYKVSEGAVSGPLHAALVLDSALAAEPWNPSAEPAPDDAARAFERHLERFADDRLVDAPNRIAQAMLDSSGERVVMIRMEAGKADLLYRYDELILQEEALFSMERYPHDSGLRGKRYAVPLMSRPLGGDWLHRDPPRWMLRHVDLDLLNPEEAMLDLTVDERIADNVFELIDWYEDRLGPFPYPELNILEINAYGFGIGPPGVLYLTREGFDPGLSGRSFRREINIRLAHEVGHMWWGHAAQMRSPDDQWLSESTVEYFAALAVDELAGRNGFEDAYRDWQAEAGNSKAAPSIYMANRLAGDRAAFDRRNLLYGSGPLMLHALRQEIGDEAFFESMKRLVAENRHRYIDTAEYIEMASEIAGRDLGAWFDRELFGVE